MIRNIIPNFYYLVIFFFIAVILTPLSIYIGNKFKIISKPHEKRGDKEKIKHKQDKSHPIYFLNLKTLKPKIKTPKQRRTIIFG